MKKLSAILWMAALMSLAAIFATLADERLPVLKVGSVVYSNVTVTSVSDTDIFFIHSRGMGNVKLKNLEPAMQQHFHFNPDKATAIEMQQKEANAKFAVRMASNTNTNKPPDAAAVAQADLADAISQVQAIINQPVKQYPEQEGIAAGHFSTWFDAGAKLPDFKNADVRTTQETNYSQFQYVVCDLNHGVVFLGDDLEFNPMTKYFYTDRTLPKKKLTQAEMNEVNRLYRLIWEASDRLADQGVKVDWK